MASVCWEAPPLVGAPLARVSGLWSQTSWSLPAAPILPQLRRTERSARWSSRWLLPSPGKEAGHRPAALDRGVGLEREASCCGRSKASPSPPVPFPGLLSPGACPCGILAWRAASRGKWLSSECSSSPWATARLRLGLSPAPCGHLPVTPYPSREMLSHG